MTKEEAKQKIAELVKKYESLSQSEIKAYHEAKTKQGFIEPLFRALGWDFENTDEVGPEENASKGRVDYAFKLHGVSQFYLEAKPLKADLTNPDYIKQAVTYAYNKGVTWAVLTDFERLRIFSSQKQTQSIPLDCKQYIEDFDRLWLLSRESLETGLLTKEAQKWGILPPPLPVETRLFTQLRQWREELFNQLYGHNKELLNFSQIDEVIQRLFNRLIFIRNAEDRGIEEKRLLSAVNQWKTGGHKKDELRKALRQIFHYFDGYYDSDLFASHLLDNEKLFIEEQTIENILSGLYEIPGSMASYDFSVIDADVLGVVYEQYLGYVAVKAKEKAEAQLKLGITDDEVFTVTSKKPHRKEQGIYYTPKFITDYIVKETVGRFIKERTGREVLNMRILDPACGSGSFLIRAYDELLNYHADQRGKAASEIDQAERLRMLTSNIFGVDLDMQAVEIARLNLLLRSLARRETLPSLAENIRQGNSLISGSEEELKGYFGDSWQEKKPFNWEQKFESIMAQGGFDVVIGNPPWVFTRDVDFGESAKRYFSDRYVGARGKVNSYALFLWRGVNLLKSEGLFSMIIPNTFLRSTTYEDLRRNLLEQYSVLEITDAGSDVFPGVTASTVILVIKKGKESPETRINTLDKTGKATLTNSVSTETVLKNPTAVISIYADDTFNQITDKVASFCKPLSAYVEHLISGIQTWKQNKSEFIANKPLTEHYKPLLEGKDIGRYKLSFADKYIRYEKSVLNVMQDENIFLLPEKILIQRVSGGQQPIKATIDTNSFYTFNSINTLVCRGLDNRYVLGLLNSRFINWYYYNRFSNRSALTVNISAKLLRNLPIPRIDLADHAQKRHHDELVALVEKMLELNKKVAALSEFEAERRQALEKEIGHTDREIDNLVYKLYDLTENEIEKVESQES